MSLYEILSLILQFIGLISLILIALQLKTEKNIIRVCMKNSGGFRL